MIVGAGGFGREVAWLVDDINQERPAFDFLGFVDDAATQTQEGYPVLGSMSDWIAAGRQDVKVVCAIGDPITRVAVVDRLAKAGLKFATLLHPSVRLSRWVTVGSGSIICAGTTLTTNITVGAHSILNLHCTVGHDAELGEYASLMPGVHISGNVVTGPGVYFGTGASAVNDLSIGAWTILGAGAVVTRNLPPAVVAVGVPAKAVKPNERALAMGGKWQYMRSRSRR